MAVELPDVECHDVKGVEMQAVVGWALLWDQSLTAAFVAGVGAVGLQYPGIEN